MSEKSQSNEATSASQNDSDATSCPKSELTVNSSESARKGFVDPTLNFLKGGLAIKVKHPINLHKGATPIFLLTLMIYFNNYSLGSFLYLSLHGTYGVIWLIKDAGFPDKSFEAKSGILTTLFLVAILTAYWVIGFIQMSGLGINHPTPERVMCCVMLMSLGSVIMMASDAQKTFTLKYKKGLINDGMFKYSRNPNYLGEIMIYCSFALATGNNISWTILLIIWLMLFVPTMIAKDASLKKKEGAKEYFDQSSILLPKIFFRNTLLHYAFWVAIFAGIYCTHQSGGLTALLPKIPRI